MARPQRSVRCPGFHVGPTYSCCGSPPLSTTTLCVPVLFLRNGFARNNLACPRWLARLARFGEPVRRPKLLPTNRLRDQRVKRWSIVVLEIVPQSRASPLALSSVPRPFSSRMAAAHSIPHMFRKRSARKCRPSVRDSVWRVSVKTP